jgi:hypothetical protein
VSALGRTHQSLSVEWLIGFMQADGTKLAQSGNCAVTIVVVAHLRRMREQNEGSHHRRDPALRA